MRLLAWNIRHGGGYRLPKIAEALDAHDADVVVLCEYRSGAAGEQLGALLRARGLEHQSSVRPPPARNGVLIASKHPLESPRRLSRNVAEPYRMVDVQIEGVRITGVYLPNLLLKVPYWEAIIRAARRRCLGPAIFLGDFNTTRHFLDETTNQCLTSGFMDRIEAAGFRDVWRDRNPAGREYTWYSHRGNGFRLDHAFCSRALAPRVREVRYVHEVREGGLSDHSQIVLDLDLPAKD